jgi:predicted thioesterase
MDIPEGLEEEAFYIVNKDMTIDFIEPRILSTPSMINLIEYTCRMMIKPYLDEEEESLGVMINAKHLAATPEGKKVMVRALLKSIEGRRLSFVVDVYDEVEKIGEALHDRIVINKHRFIEHIKKKV